MSFTPGRGRGFYADPASPIASTPQRAGGKIARAAAPPATPAMASLSPMKPADRPLQRHNPPEEINKSWGGIFSPVFKKYFGHDDGSSPTASSSPTATLPASPSPDVASSSFGSTASGGLSSTVSSSSLSSRGSGSHSLSSHAASPSHGAGNITLSPAPVSSVGGARRTGATVSTILPTNGSNGAPKSSNSGGGADTPSHGLAQRTAASLSLYGPPTPGPPPTPTGGPTAAASNGRFPVSSSGAGAAAAATPAGGATRSSMSSIYRFATQTSDDANGGGGSGTESDTAMSELSPTSTSGNSAMSTAAAVQISNTSSSAAAGGGAVTTTTTSTVSQLTMLSAGSGGHTASIMTQATQSSYSASTPSTGGGAAGRVMEMSAAAAATPSSAAGGSSYGSALAVASTPAAAAAPAEAADEDYEYAYEEFNPYLFIKMLPLYASVAPRMPRIVLPKKSARRKGDVSLVLDLDETLVHCSVDPINDADFQFPVSFNDCDYQVFVRKRPYLDKFLAWVSSRFEVVIFTASQQVYAEKLLSMVDPGSRLIEHKLYRDSCLNVDGNFLKDLNVLGRDLSRTVLVDNSPHAFGYQLDNGIPIESWFDDRGDTELLKLMKFLETLLPHPGDVRPLVRERFNVHRLVAEAMPSPNLLY